MNTQQAFLTTCFEYVQTDGGMDFAQLWYLMGGDNFESRFLGRTAEIPEEDALVMAARIAGDTPVRRMK